MIKRRTHCCLSPSDHCCGCRRCQIEKVFNLPVWFIFRSQSQFAFQLLQSLTLFSRPLFTRYQVPPPESGLVQLGLGDNNQIRVYHYWSRLAPNVAPHASLEDFGAAGSTVVPPPPPESCAACLEQRFPDRVPRLRLEENDEWPVDCAARGWGERGGSSAIRQQNTCPVPDSLSRQS